MKNHIILFAITFLSLNNLESAAQTKFGVKAGIGLSPRLSYTVGVVALHELSSKLNLQTGIQLTNYRYGTNKVFDQLTVIQNHAVTYLEVPSTIGYKLSRFQIFTGPYIGFAISGKGDYDLKSKIDPQFSISGNYTYYIRYKHEGGYYDTEVYVRSVDLGMKLGAGYDLGHFLFSSTGTIGLTDTYPVTKVKTDFKSKNLSLTLATTYFF